VPDRLVGGVRLFVDEFGAGEPILLIHGTGSSSDAWSPRSVDELAALGRVIVYDRRGYARSEHPESHGPSTVDVHADDAAALIDVLAGRPAIVIGRSYGGEVALNLALRSPERVRGLVLLEPALFGLSEEAAAWEQRLHARVREAAARDPRTVGRTFVGAVLGPQAWDGLPRAQRTAITADGATIVHELGGGRLEADPARLASIAIPTLVVAASGSPPAFREVSTTLADRIPDSELAIVPGAHRVDPAEPAVLAFVRRVLGA